MPATPARTVDASALSVVFAIRIDHADRLENIETTARYVRERFVGSEMVLVECDSEPRVPDTVKQHFDKVLFIESPGPFAKSHCMNSGLMACTRPVVAFYDADVIVDPEAIRWSIEKIMCKIYPVVLPFNGIFVDIEKDLRRKVINDLDAGPLASQSKDAINAVDGAEARIVDGGVFLADREVMTQEGGYNSKMISYGWEDIEVLLRLEKLGYYRGYARHNLIHLNHARGMDSVKNEHTDRNHDEYLRVRGMSRPVLQSYVDSDLDISGNPGQSPARKTVRQKLSRAPISLTHMNALLSKVTSRLRHRL